MYDLEAGWKCQLISYLANFSKHLKRAKLSWTQLAPPSKLHDSFGQ